MYCDVHGNVTACTYACELIASSGGGNRKKLGGLKFELVMLNY